ncbi:hypothetical protein EII22_08835 [Coriobacteriales bacterium OH1046]|nr:hypothetical protein EII22_08835 [Coriobacteriales bacterium OH1046]
METISSPRIVKARKHHRCSWCGKEISRGEFHTVSTLKDDEIYTWRECERCAEYVSEMIEGYCYWDLSDGVTSAEFIEFMREEHPDVLEEWRTYDGC